MTTALAKPAPQQMSLFTTAQVDVLKRTICRGATDDEFIMFMRVCEHTRLDPFLKQLYFVKRWSSKERKEIGAVQIGIDGYRLVAERTGKYMPGREPSFRYTGPEQKIPHSATAYVKKLAPDGTWHEVSATAFYSEYVQMDKTGKNPNSFWTKSPHNQTAKCAEALAIRRTHPFELSGTHTPDEMAVADAPRAAGNTGADGVLDVETGEVLPAPDDTDDTIELQERIRTMILKMVGVPDTELTDPTTNTINSAARARFIEITGLEDYKALTGADLEEAHRKVLDEFSRWKLGPPKGEKVEAPAPATPAETTTPASTPPASSNLPFGQGESDG